VPRPHPLHGCGIITPFRILNAWEAQYCSRVEFLQKRVSPTNNQLQGISLLSMLTFIFKKIYITCFGRRAVAEICQDFFINTCEK
jgi:hypothetical protein